MGGKGRKMTITEKSVLLGFAITYRFENQGFNEHGKKVYTHSAIRLAPRIIQANALPKELVVSIARFLQEHIEQIDE